MPKQFAPYGTWPSPISPRMMSETLRLDDVQWDTATETLVWLEGRSGRGVLVAQEAGQAPRDVTSDLSVRGGVGYGGGAFTVAEGVAYFAAEGRIYRQALAVGGGRARAITPAVGGVAAPTVSPDGKWLLYVYSHEDQDGLALVDTAGKLWPRKFAEGTDFVMQPCWHPTQPLVAYVTWDHPQMPWDGTLLHLATYALDAQGVPYITQDTVLTGDAQTAIFQPAFSPDGRSLSYVSDASGWNQLYCYDLNSQQPTQLTHDSADHGMPGWIQGMRTYGWCADSRHVVCSRNQQGARGLILLDTHAAHPQPVPVLPEDYSDAQQVAVSAGGQVAVIASSSRIAPRIISLQLPLSDPSRIQVHKRSSTEHIPPEQLPSVEPIQWAGTGGETIYGLYAAPVSDRFESAGAPPLLVYVHGGPTSQSFNDYSQGLVQFFTTRGIAVLRLNHRGGTGYGRAYMERLHGNWGVVDVEDAVSGAAYLTEHGLANPRQLMIYGSSAGGYTVLNALVQNPGFWRAGISLYGVTNLFTLALDTHKFESRYNDYLLGALPEATEVWRERSPLFHAERMSDPVLLFQGADDNVVPPNQAEALVKVLQARGVPHEYHLYAGEGHGFRKAETIEHHFRTTMQFIQRHVVFA
jgi:dipeptidyl aminopeptidase/acylaminoacyl peptidase